MRKVPALERLASEEVGKPGGSSLIFVSEEGIIRAVFTDRSDMEAAIQFADSLPRRSSVIVEDETGVVWENAESKRRQREEED